MVDMLIQRLPELGIEIAVPDGWSVGGSDSADVLFQAPEEHGYRTTVSIVPDRLEPPTPERFEEVIGGIPEALGSRHAGLEVVTQKRFAQNGLPAWLIRYRWDDPDHEETFEQVMTLVVVSPETGHLVQIDASTIAPLAKSHLPVLQAVIGTVRAVGSDDA